MIPETLIIKGLYSYQQETIFDFTPLTQAGLFGIFGAVGSGKSTILEAITFALYGETERLNNRDGRGYNMMNLKSNDLLIDFVFTSGSQDQKYRFTVSTKRNKKRYNETDSFKKDAYEWINGNWQPTPKTAEDIIGLSYENFKRTIIIPQGKFQEFLQLKDTERVQMLKEIFNLEKYELGPKVGSLSKANDIKISHVEGQMLALPIFSEEDLKNQEHGIQEQEKLLAAQMTHFAMLEQQQKVFELTKLLFEEAAKKEAHYHELQTQEVDFLAKEEQLATYENCEKIFKNLFEQKDKIQKSIVEKQAKIAGHEKENKEVEQAIEAAQATLNNLEKRYSERDTLLQKAAELEKILAIKKLQLNINQLSTRLTNGKKKISDSERQLADGQQGALLLQNQIAAKEKQLPDISFIIKITDWFAKQEQLILESQKLSKEMTIAENKLPLMLQQIGGVLQSFPEGLKFDNIPEDLATVEAKANELFDSYKNRIGILNDELAHVQLAQKLGEFSANLKPGDPCPLCGALEHPNPLSEVNPGENIQRLRQDIKEWESATSSAQKKLVECASLYAAYTAQLAQVNQIKKQTEKAAKDLISYNNTFAFEGFTILDESLAKNQLNTHQQLSNELTSLRTQLQETQKSNDETAKSLSTYKTAIEQFLVDQAKAMSEANLLKTQITALDFEATVNKEESVLIKSVVAFQTEWKELTNVHEDTSKQMQQHLTRQGGIRGKLDEMRNQLLQENIEGDRLNGQIATQMLEHNYSSEHDIKQILATSINVTSVRSAVNDYRQQLHTASIQLKEAREKTTGKTYDTVAHSNLLSQIDTARSKVKDLTELVVTLKNDLLQNKRQWQERLVLQKDLDKLVERATNLKILNNLFRSGGFVNYVSSVYLQNLVNAANKRFYKMTSQKLLLELTSENAFQVRDFWNNGEVRSIKTLSGGQTFQAALSLALALADNIQHLTKANQNFFFLDEGFGSLDKHSLKIVFDTLQNLKKENRIVGIISHVEEMQQEIDLHLKIVNDDITGSYVIRSWH